MTVAAVTRYAERFVQGTDPDEMIRRARLLQQRLDEDPAYAAAEARRRARIQNDPYRPDWLKEIYLDQTILDNEQLRVFFGELSIQKVWDLSAPLQHKRRPRPHPRMSPKPDVGLKVVADRVSPGVQLGKAAEWWVGSHRGLIDALRETLTPNEAPQRHGRARGPELIEDEWFTEYAREIKAVQQVVKDWVKNPSATTIKSLLELGQRKTFTERADMRCTRNYEDAKRVSRCLRVLRSQALEKKRKAAKKSIV